MSAELHKIEDAARLAMADFDSTDRNVASAPNMSRLTAIVIVAAAICLSVLSFLLN